MKGIYVCPNCGSFVSLDDELCQECDEDITLFNEEELESNFVPVVIYTSESLGDAQALVEFLHDNDITSTYIDFDSQARELLKDTASDNVLVVVLEQNVAKAEEMVEEYLAYISDSDDEEKEWSDEDEFDVEDDEELSDDVGSNHIA